MLKGRDGCSGNENISDWFLLIWEEKNGIFLGPEFLLWLPVMKSHIQHLQTYWELSKPHFSWETQFPQALWRFTPVLVGARREEASLRKALQEKLGKSICGEFVEPKEEITGVKEEAQAEFRVPRWSLHQQFPFQDHVRGTSHTLSPSPPWRDEVQHGSLQCTRLEIISLGQKGVVGSGCHPQMPAFGSVQRMTVTGTGIWTGKAVPSAIFGHDYCCVCYYYYYHHSNYSSGAWDQISF